MLLFCDEHQPPELILALLIPHDDFHDIFVKLRRSIFP